LFVEYLNVGFELWFLICGELYSEGCWYGFNDGRAAVVETSKIFDAAD